LLAREQSLKLRLDGKAELLMHLKGTEANRKATAPVEREVRDLTARYDQLQAEIRSKSPHYAALTQPRPLGLEGIQEQVLDEDTLLLEYALGEDRSYLWAVSSRRHTGYELPPRTHIEQSARRVYELLTARLPRPGEPVRDYRLRVKAADSQYWEAAARLSKMLLGPVAESMAGKRLLVVGDGALQYVPFGALPAPGTGDDPVPMIVEHEIVNLPSASTLAVLRDQTRGRRENRKSVAVLADPVFERDDPRLRRKISSNAQPDPPPPATGVLRALIQLREGGLSMPRLLSARREADAIVAVAPEGSSWIGIDFEASRTAAMNPELGEYQIVHFATHAVVNSENPGMSGIILSMVDEDGQPQNGFGHQERPFQPERPITPRQS
ncbi:MAG: CHAT domain-containing protein, partial [bacterium]|nr:CHAT domain-containing protein [bacterium]